MTPPPFNLLTDTDENPAVPDSTPEQLEEMAKKPASMLWTARQIERARLTCWAFRWVKRFRLWLIFAAGAALVVQIGGFVVLRLAVKDFELRTAALVKKTVEDVLKEHGFTSGATPPKTGDAVATMSREGVFYP